MTQVNKQFFFVCLFVLDENEYEEKINDNFFGDEKQPWDVSWVMEHDKGNSPKICTLFCFIKNRDFRV